MPLPASATWRLFLGPGARLRTLRPLFEAACGDSARPSVECLDDLADLLLRPDRGTAAAGRLVLDVDALPREDVGLLYRTRRRCPGLEIVLVGEDPSKPGARELLAVGAARWQPWPLDVEQLGGLAGRPPAQVEPTPAARPDEPPLRPQAAADRPPVERAPAPPVRETGDETASSAELSQIQRILDGGDEWIVGGRDVLEAQAPVRPPSPPPRAPEVRRVVGAWPGIAPGSPERVSRDTGSSDGALPPLRDGAPAGPTRTADAARVSPAWTWRSRLPAFYRGQIGDLADIAQRLQLSLNDSGAPSAGAPGVPGAQGAPASSEGSPAGMPRLEAEVWRLVQFARTLSYIVSPPQAGEQSIDLAVLVDELLAGMSADGGASPRFMRDGEDSLPVRSDKGLLVRALDALLQVARVCSTGQDTVLVTTSRGLAPVREEGCLALLEVSFPAGPLADMRPEEITAPYALRRRLSTIGPNALAAAEGILRGQGGGLTLDSPEPDRLRWTAYLPLREVARWPSPPSQEGALPPAARPSEATGAARPPRREPLGGPFD